MHYLTHKFYIVLNFFTDRVSLRLIIH